MSSNDQKERTTMSGNDQETDPRRAWTRQLLDAALNGEWAVIVQELSPADDIHEVRGLLGDMLGILGKEQLTLAAAQIAGTIAAPHDEAHAASSVGARAQLAELNRERRVRAVAGLIEEILAVERAIDEMQVHRQSLGTPSGLRGGSDRATRLRQVVILENALVRYAVKDGR